MCHWYVIIFCQSVSLTRLSASGAIGVNFRKRILCNSCVLLVPSLRTMEILLGKAFLTLEWPAHLNSRNGILVACVSAFGFRM